MPLRPDPEADANRPHGGVIARHAYTPPCLRPPAVEVEGLVAVVAGKEALALKVGHHLGKVRPAGRG